MKFVVGTLFAFNIICPYMDYDAYPKFLLVGTNSAFWFGAILFIYFYEHRIWPKSR